MSRIINPSTVTLPPGWWPGTQQPTSDGTESERAPKVNFRWATVAQADPVRVRFDGDIAAIDADVDRLVHLKELVVGRRVWVQLYERRVIILGVSSGSLYPPRPADIIGVSPLETTYTTTGSSTSVSGLTKTFMVSTSGTIEVSMGLDVSFSGPDTFIATVTVNGVVSSTQAIASLPSYATGGYTRLPVSKTWIFPNISAGICTITVQAWSTGSSIVAVVAPHSQYTYRHSAN